jgi:GR25 family glycosyltransferase involved in LPS biosynthesis
MLKKFEEFQAKKIYFALDYSKSELVQEKQKEFITKIERLKDKTEIDIEVWKKSRNHGVAVSVISALDWFFEREEMGIVLEDDLVFDKDFLEYCNKALSKYKAQKEVVMISGNRFDLSDSDKSVVATNYPQIWGWATWRDRWLQMRKFITGEKKLTLSQWNSLPSLYFYAGAKRAQAGSVDTWDLPLAYEMYVNELICVLPPVNLVSNIGNDQHSAHTKNNDFPMNFPIAKLGEAILTDMPELKETLEMSNRFLEKVVFGINSRNILSVLKLRIEIIFHRLKKKNSKTLIQRLAEAEAIVK